MGDVISLETFRRKKSVGKMEEEAKRLGIDLSAWSVTPPPPAQYIDHEEMSKIFGVVPMTRTQVELLVNKAIMGFYSSAMPARLSRGRFQELWPVFIAMKDDFEARALKVVDLHFLYKEMGCRPGEALALGELRETLGELGKKLHAFWVEYY